MTLSRGSISPATNKQTAGLVKRKDEILKQQIKLLTGKTTLVRWIKVLTQALIHLDDQPVGPIAPYARLGSPVETPNTLKLRESWRITITSTLTVDQCAVLLRTLSPIKAGKRIICWDLQWDIPPGWVSYSAPLHGKELLNLPWDPIVLLQARTIGMDCT